jgi:hypothetical protein
MAVNPKLRYTSTTKSTKKTTPTATTKPSPKKAAESQNMGQGYWKDNKGRVYKADASTKWARQYVQNKPGNSYTQIGDNKYQQANGGIFSFETGAYTEGGKELYGKHRAYEADPRKEAAKQINTTFDKQKESQLTEYRRQRDNAVKGVQGQKGQVTEQFYGQKNQADVVSQQNVNRLKEMLAASGLSKSGENVTANIQAANTRQNALNTLSKQEMDQQGQLDQRIGELKDPAQEKAMTAQIEAARSQALTEAWNRSDDKVTAEKNAWQAAQMQNAQFAFQQQQAALQQSNWQNQFNTTNSQWNQQFDATNSQWNQQFNFNKDQAAVQNSQWDKTFNQNTSQFNQTLAFQKEQWKAEFAQNKTAWQAEQDWRKYQFNNMSASEKAQLELNKSQFGEEMAWRQYELNYNGNLAMSQAQTQANAYAGMSGDTSGFLG